MRALFLLVLASAYVTFLQAQTSNIPLLKQYKQALKEYKTSPYSYEKIMKLAHIAFDAGNFKQSYDLVLIVLERKNNDVDALTLYANILIEYGYEDKARRKLAKIIELYPQTQAEKHARNTLSMLDRLHNRLQKQYSYKVQVGIDSNPSHDSKNNYLSDFIVTVACQGKGSDCDYNQRFKSINSYIDIDFKGDYVYDPGSLGAFFVAYGWQVSTKNYLEVIDAGDFAVELNFGLGVATQKMGSFHLPFTLGEHINKLSIDGKSKAIQYSSLKIKPHYRYRFQDHSLLSVGIEHEEEDSSNSFTYGDLNSTYVSSMNYSSNRSFLFLDYRSKFYDKHPVGIKLYSGSQDEKSNDRMYFNMARIPYLNYDFSGLAIDFEYKKNPRESYRAVLNLLKRRYFDYYKQDLPPPLNYEQRRDDILSLDTQLLFINDDLSKSILGYRIYVNSTNYEPLDFIKHELYYSYYWLP